MWVSSPTASSDISCGAAVWSTITPITSPERAVTGTAAIDCQRSSSSSGKYFMRGSCERLVADERRLVPSRDPARDALVQAHLDPPDDVAVHRRRGAQHEAVALEQVDQARVAAGGLGRDVDHAGEHLVELERRGHGA